MKVLLLIIAAITVITLGVAIGVNARVTAMQYTVASTKKAVDSNISSYLGSYQLTLKKDSVFIWDGTRYVGGFKLDYDKDPVSTMIIEDNQ